MHREPATWSTRDRVTYYLTDAARFRRMAEAENRAAVRARLVALARHYRRVASTVESRPSAAA